MVHQEDRSEKATMDPVLGTVTMSGLQRPKVMWSLTPPTLAYVTCQDLRSIADPAEQMVMVIKAPPETQLQAVDSSEVRPGTPGPTRTSWAGIVVTWASGNSACCLYLELSDLPQEQTRPY